MHLQDKVKKTGNVCVFCRNDDDDLQEVVKIHAKEPKTVKIFRSCIVWASARAALDSHTLVHIYFAPIKGKGIVQYRARLVEVHLHPTLEQYQNELRSKCLERTKDEDLWEKYDKTVRTCYGISHCVRVKEIPFTQFIKVNNNKHLDENYSRAYALCYIPQEDVSFTQRDFR